MKKNIPFLFMVCSFLFKAIFLSDTISINCYVCAGLFSAADHCFPRARLQPPREIHSAGSSDTCCSRRSQRSSAPNNHHIEYNNNQEPDNYSTSGGKTRRLLGLRVNARPTEKICGSRGVATEKVVDCKNLVFSP